MKKCLIYLEKGYETYSIDLLRVAQAMYGEEYHADALTVGGDISKAVGCFDRIFQVPEEAVPDYDLTAITDVLEELMKAEGFHSILIPATYTGRMLAPRAAMRLETGLVADVTEVEVHDGSVIMVRPAFSGKIMAGIVNEETAPIMMSIRPGVFTCEAPASRNTETITLTPERRQPPRVVRVSRQEKGISTDIRESEILVSGGGGVMKHMDVVEALAQALGGMAAASRRTVDSGKADRSIQVGQSGKVVHPRLYIAAGIFGSIQHIAGLNRVEHLIAINTDAKAPICSLADIVVEGDARDFMEKLIRRIKQVQ